MSKQIQINTNKQLKQQLRYLKQKKIKLLQQKETYQKEHGSEFFRPLPYQKLLIDYLRAGKKRLLLQGGNQIGKTLTGANLVDSFVSGRQAWDGKKSIFGNRPTKGRIICTDWEYHANGVIVPKLKEMLPKGSYQTTKNNQGTEAFWTFPNGSAFYLMTIKQDTQSHESATLDWVWGDEPMPQDKYSANCRGLVRQSGIFLLTLTAVGKESWMLDEIALNTGATYGCVTRVPMRANTYLKEADIVQFEKDCPELEIPARIYGEWLQLTGKVVKTFNKEKHLVTPFKIPTTWAVIPFIDIALNKPQAISFFAWDHLGREYVIDEIWDNLNPEEIAEAIVRKKIEEHWNIQLCGIDPLAKGDSAYVRNRYGEVRDTYYIIQDILDEAGIELFAASKDKDSGIRNINASLIGVNNQPALFFFEGKTEKTLWQLQRWIYDDFGKPMKKDDDFPENLYRSTLLGYTEIAFSEPENNIKQTFDNFDSLSKRYQNSYNSWMSA